MKIIFNGVQDVVNNMISAVFKKIVLYLSGQFLNDNETGYGKKYGTFYGGGL